ncbi:MAG: hypothetical protein ACI805_002371 [Candidatus Azotimanducaceae bacterium]|jgi:hypothetical protein
MDDRWIVDFIGAMHFASMTNLTIALITWVWVSKISLPFRTAPTNDDDADQYTSVTGVRKIAVASALWENPVLRVELDRLGIQSKDDLEILSFASKLQLEPAGGYSKVNTDFYPYLDLNASKSRFL